MTHHHHPSPAHPSVQARPGSTFAWRAASGLLMIGAIVWFTSARAEEAAQPTGKSMGEQVREALSDSAAAKKRLTLVVNGKRAAVMPPGGKEATGATASGHASGDATRKVSAAGVNPQTSRQYIRARAAALSGQAMPVAENADSHGAQAHWTYSGETGPQAWAKLNPDYGTCANGERQSPINIDEAITLKGPAEVLQFNYRPSSGTVVNNGHTIQVDLYGENDLTVRGTVFRLVQLHFHHPSEERVNFRSYAMVAHLVHKDNEGRLAVVAVLLEPGTDNALINKVWTHMPLDVDDRVRLPTGLIDMNELLPKDQRYYQFMGSLTTPPCTEGVLWMVLKQPTSLSQTQLRLFSQLFPNNARPVQPLNGRAVRDAQ